MGRIRQALPEQMLNSTSTIVAQTMTNSACSIQRVGLWVQKPYLERTWNKKLQMLCSCLGPVEFQQQRGDCKGLNNYQNSGPIFLLQLHFHIPQTSLSLRLVIIWAARDIGRYIYIYTHINVKGMYVCVSPHPCIYIYNTHIYIYIYIYTHANRITRGPVPAADGRKPQLTPLPR